jgi:decaprenylphospho-beta-D-ribofuranose 2-oxidase
VVGSKARLVSTRKGRGVSELSSFDGTETIRGELACPDRYRHLFATLSSGRTVIPRGAGLSYCNASAGIGVRSVSSLRFDRILDWDEESGRVVVEPGLRVGDLLEFASARRWLPAVLPGHPMISVGGCVGFNVHGKSQYHGGNFIDCLERIVVFHPDRGEIACGPSEEPELFELTVGGFGLTGFITSVCIRLQRLRGTAIRRDRIPVRNLLEAVQVMEAHCEEVDALYSWNDLNRRGESFGRGIVYLERFCSDPPPRATRFRRLSPEARGRLPWGVFSAPVTKAFTRAYGALESRRGKQSLLDLKAGSFPINGKETYFRLFGSTGLREYQLLVPRSSWESVVAELERILARSGVPATLGSLKLFRGETRLLNFAGSGVCLALDVPATPGALGLFELLDALVLEAGGIVNLSKDSRLSGAFLRKVFPEYEAFRERLGNYDPKRRFDSALRRRIDV